MPTPFTHLEIQRRMLDDPRIPADMRAFLKSQLPAYTLGSIAPDALVGRGVGRSATHFYDYMDEVVGRLWRIMTRRYPTLMTPEDDAHRTFVAAVVSHLSVDEVWTLRMVRPHFARREWAGRRERFFMLHVMLTCIDERDLARIPDEVAGQLGRAAPQHWLPFIDDVALVDWRDMIREQLVADGSSRTLEIFSNRVGSSPEEMLAVMQSSEAMERRLWQHIPRAYVAQVERDCYVYARRQMVAYLRETG